MPSTTRRHVLSLLGVATTGLIGGCLQSLPTNRNDSTSQLTFRLQALENSLYDRHVVDLDETRASWDENAFEAALNGSEFTTQHRVPFPPSTVDDPSYTVRNGSYYHLDDVVVGQETVAHSVLRLYEVGEVGQMNDPPAHVAHADLPQIDKRAVNIAYMAARARGNQGGVPWGLAQRGGYVYREQNARTESSLLGKSGPSHVSYRNHIYRVETTTETFHEAVYRPDVEPVAETEAELEQILQAQLLDSRLDPTTLSDAEQEIVREARDSGYQASYPYPKALNSLLKKLNQRAYIDGNISKDGRHPQSGNDYLLKYGETYYEYRLQLETE